MDDCISRQGIIKKAFTVEYTDMWHMTVSEKVVSVKDIEDMPSVTPTERIEYGTDGNAYKLSMTNGKEYETERTGHWIPVSEGLPEDEQEILFI